MQADIFHRNRQTVRPSFISCATAILVAAVLATAFPVSAFAQAVPGGCGSLANAFGPFDYRVEKYIRETTYGSHAAQLRIVEGAHFTPAVEALIRGTSGGIFGDLNYTLRAFPNHHRALLSMTTLAKREKSGIPNDPLNSIDCYYQRAIAWRPDDNIVRMLYAEYLVGKARNGEAEQQLLFAANQAGSNAFTLNNIGLIYFDMKNYDKAIEFARKAIELGLETPTVKEQLKSVGRWTEPADSTTVGPTNALQ